MQSKQKSVLVPVGSGAKMTDRETTVAYSPQLGSVAVFLSRRAFVPLNQQHVSYPGASVHVWVSLCPLLLFQSVCSGLSGVFLEGHIFPQRLQRLHHACLDFLGWIQEHCCCVVLKGSEK